MPELPDVVVYIEALERRIVGHRLTRILIRGPFLLRSTTPPVESIQGKTVRVVRRIGKQIAIGFEGANVVREVFLKDVKLTSMRTNALAHVLNVLNVLHAVGLPEDVVPNPPLPPRREAVICSVS